MRCDRRSFPRATYKFLDHPKFTHFTRIDRDETPSSRLRARWFIGAEDYARGQTHIIVWANWRHLGARLHRLPYYQYRGQRCLRKTSCIMRVASTGRAI